MSTNLFRRLFSLISRSDGNEQSTAEKSGKRRCCIKCGKQFVGATTVLLSLGNVLKGVVCPSCGDQN